MGWEAKMNPADDLRKIAKSLRAVDEAKFWKDQNDKADAQNNKRLQQLKKGPKPLAKDVSLVKSLFAAPRADFEEAEGGSPNHWTISSYDEEYDDYDVIAIGFREREAWANAADIVRGTRKPFDLNKAINWKSWQRG
jgi:hypothetical protein